MRYFFITALVLVLVCGSTIWGQYVESQIIQVRLNRLYFEHGVEGGIFAGTPFAVYCGENEIISGIIDYAGPGISFSRPIAEIDERLFSDSCLARLTTAVVDTKAVITLGTDLPLELFNISRETLFERVNDSIFPTLADSLSISGRELTLYLNPSIRYSDDTRLNSETVHWWLDDLNYRSRSYAVRYFFAKLKPLNEDGIEIIDGFTLHLRFKQPFPRAGYFLSHPDFQVYNRSYLGTGAFREIGQAMAGEQLRAFVPNESYRGDIPQVEKIIIKYFRQSYRMKFEYENDMSDGYIGFGYEDDLAGVYEAKALYPYLAVMLAGIGGDSFSRGLLPSSIYYRYDPERRHLYFPYGATESILRWIIRDDSAEPAGRYHPFDTERGRSLHRIILNNAPRVEICYDNSLLYETGRYVADIAAREGTIADLKKYNYGQSFDIHVAFFPASDNIIPFALISAVLELNDQNSTLPQDQRMNRPGWDDLGRGTSLLNPENRDRFFARAEATIFEEASFFPLFRPWIYAVGSDRFKGMKFDFYGIPDLDDITAFRAFTIGGN
ncbi:MAG: ABC transporter substrate-binding protein [candidate division Zixibacteria bacterium]